MNNINLVTDETNTVSELLKKKNIIQNTDIDTHIDKMEQGIIFDYDDTGSDENNYQSEDENLITLSVNSISSNLHNDIKNSKSFGKDSFRKLEYKDVNSTVLCNLSY